MKIIQPWLDQMSIWLDAALSLGIHMVVWFFILIFYAMMGYFLGSRVANYKRDGDNLEWATLGLLLSVFALFPFTVYWFYI